MAVDLKQVAENYQADGYHVLRNYFTPDDMAALRKVILKFHQMWKQDNAEFYREVAFNSSLITGSEYLSSSDRVVLFNFISSSKMMTLIDTIILRDPVFMNTQLFFNPINPELKDFWHRDCQYDHEIEAQQRIIKQDQVLHLRIPLFDELGIELVPGSHKRWDNKEELDVRQEINGRFSNEELPLGEKIPLAAGDILLFSADMLHRGLYGLDRLAFDILVFGSSPNYVNYIDDDCLPEPEMLKEINNPRLFTNSYKLKESAYKADNQ